MHFISASLWQKFLACEPVARCYFGCGSRRSTCSLKMQCPCRTLSPLKAAGVRSLDFKFQLFTVRKTCCSGFRSASPSSMKQETPRRASTNRKADIWMWTWCFSNIFWGFSMRSVLVPGQVKKDHVKQAKKDQKDSIQMRRGFRLNMNDWDQAWPSQPAFANWLNNCIVLLNAGSYATICSGCRSNDFALQGALFLSWM